MPSRYVNIPCPLCNSSDAGTIYRNKDKTTGEYFYMFRCESGNHTGHPNNIRIEDPDNYEEEILNPKSRSKKEATEPTLENIGLVSGGRAVALDNPDDPWGVRGINEETMAYYGVTVKEDMPITRNRKLLEQRQMDGLPTRGKGLIFPFYSSTGDNQLICQKVRTEVDRKGTWYKSGDTSVSMAGFFGQNLFNANVIKEIAVTFGELDAMAVHQMIGVPTVSVSNGDNSAQGQFRNEYSWLSKFDKIILVPDNDASCKSIIPLLGAIFPRKIRVVELTKFKDPCDYLVNGQRNAFAEEFYAAQPYSPEKIIGLYSLKNLIFEDPPEPLADYPWAGVNEKTGGIWAGELVVLKAFPKIGKTTVSSEIVYHLNKTTDYPMGLIFLEETQRDLIVRFATMELDKNLQKRDIYMNTNPQEIADAIDITLSDEKITLLDHFGSCSSDFLEEKIKEFVLAKGCQFIFFDHISMAITDESNKDERIAIDRLVAAIKALTVGIPDVITVEDKENGGTKQQPITRQPTIFMVTHVNDDGKPRGSRAPIQMCNTLISLERDKNATDSNKRNTLNVFVEENRRFGDTGLASVLTYNPATGRLLEAPIDQQTEGYNYES
jgi:twinkle protein